MDRPIVNTNYLTDDIAARMSKALTTSTSLMDISMRYSNILDLGTKLIANSLLNNFNLLSLNLECNAVGIPGCEAIASYLITRKNDSLKALFLSCNKIGDDGAIALAEVCFILVNFFL
jgi:hypothetical protein